MSNLHKLFIGDGVNRFSFILSKRQADFSGKRTEHIDNIADLCAAIEHAITVYPDVKVRQIGIQDSDFKVKLKFRFHNGFVVVPKLKGFAYTDAEGNNVYPTLQQFIDHQEPAEVNIDDKPIVQHLMDLSRGFRSTPSDLYNRVYGHLETEIYRALDSKSKGIKFIPKELTFE